MLHCHNLAKLNNIFVLKLATHQPDFGSQRQSGIRGALLRLVCPARSSLYGTFSHLPFNMLNRPREVRESRPKQSLWLAVHTTAVCWQGQLLPLVDWSICSVFVGGRHSRRRRRSWRKSRDAIGTRSLVSGGCVAALKVSTCLHRCVFLISSAAGVKHVRTCPPTLVHNSNRYT